MEALIAMIAELVLSVIVPLYLVLFLVLSPLFAFLVELVFDLIGMKSRAKVQAQSNESDTSSESIHDNDLGVEQAKESGLILYGIKWLTLSLATIAIVVVLILNFIFFESTVNWGLSRIQHKTGMTISYKKVNGSLLTGEFEFSGLKAVRKGHEYTDFNIDIEKAKLNIDYLKSLFGSMSVNGMTLANVQGKLFRHKKMPRHLKKHKHYKIDNLKISRLKLEIVNHFMLSKDNILNVSLDKIESRLFRRHYAVFDLFFRSSMTGNIDGAPVKVATWLTAGKPVTHWDIKNLPSATLQKLGSKSFAWVRAGELDVKVTDYGRARSYSEIDTQWSVTTRGLNSNMPTELRGFKKLAFKPVLSYLNSRQGNHSLLFGITLKEKDFAGHTNFNSAKLRQSVIKGTLARILNESKGPIRKLMLRKAIKYWNTRND